jgi:putative ABC transport system permease protein
MNKNMKTLIKLAWRNIWRNKRRSLISIASVLFAVFFASSFESMERGSYERMVKNMLKMQTGYIQIQDVYYQEEQSIDNILLYDDEIKNILNGFDDEIDYVVPRLESFALIASEKNTRGAMIIGIIPEKENQMNSWSDKIIEGKSFNKNDNGIIIGKGLSEILKLEIGDSLIIIGQGFQGVNASGIFPIQGIIDLIIPEMNNTFIYMSLETAQWLYGAENRLSSLIVMPKDPDNTIMLADNIDKRLDSEWFNVLTWEEMLQDFLRMMEFSVVTSKMIGLILFIIIGFGLFATVLTMMLERIKEFTMLISLGMKRSQLAIICMLETFFISIIGVISGLIVSIPILTILHYYPIKLTGETANTLMEYGFEPIMPTSIHPDIFITQSLVVIVISFIVGIFPIYKTYKLKLIN